jgi:protein-S-isoprenylcysteine O-methyltransferase Ste14
MRVVNEHGRTVAGVVSELKYELKDFVLTRVDMARSELRDKVKSWKMAAPMVGIAVVLVATAWLVLTASLVSLLATAFYPSRFAYFFATLIVGLVYLFGGSMCGLIAWRTFREQGVMPQRTLQVLKEDKIWLGKEARSA